MGSAGIASRGSSRPGARRWWPRRRPPRRDAQGVGPDDAKPFSFKNLVFRSHSENNSVNMSHPRCNFGSP